MRFAVVTLQFGALPYFRDSTAINAAYCARHGLTWAVRPPVDVDDRHRVWSKVAIVAKEIETAEHVLFLDADAVFVDHSRSPEHLLSLLGVQGSMLIGSDASGQCNTGAFLVRQNDAARRLLADWWTVPEHDRTHALRWPLEQGAFNKHIRGRYQSVIRSPSRSELDMIDGDFIRHYAAQPPADKARHISAEHSRLAQAYGWTPR